MESPFACCSEARQKFCGEKISAAYSSESQLGIWFFDDEVCFAATCRDNASPEDFRDDLPGIAGAVQAKVRELIRGKTLRVESAKTDFVAEKGPAGHGHAAGEQYFDGRIEPQNGDAGASKKFRAAGLGVGTAAESEDSRFLEFGSAAQGGAQLIRFDLSKSRLAKALEELRDSQAGGLLDALIQVDEAPRELPCQERADGCLAGTHETGEANHLRAGGGAA